MERNFAEYLFEIGFIDSKTISQIIFLYNNKKDTFGIYNQFNKKMTEILLLFFNNITDIQKKFICFHLPVKFIKSAKLKLKNILKNIIHKNGLKNKIILLKYLFRWIRYKNNLKNNNQEKIYDAKIENKNIFHQQSHKSIRVSSLKKKIITCKNNNIYNDILKFIDKTKNLNSQNNDIKDNLFEKQSKKDDNMNIQITKKLKNSYNKKNLNICDINLINEDKNINYLNKGQIYDENKRKKYINNDSISNLIKNFSLNNEKIRNINLMNINDFMDSIGSNENYISTNFNSDNRCEKKKEYKNISNILNVQTNISHKNESNINLFNTPRIAENSKIQNIINLNPKKINNMYNLIYCNNYKNLYNNYKRNSNTIDYNLFTEKEIFSEEEKKEIESKRNQRYSLGKKLYEKGLKRKKIQNDSKKSFHQKEQKNSKYKHINSLYKTYNRSKTFQKVKNKVEKEEGLTFHPRINKSSYTKRITSNFLERNYSNPKTEKSINGYNDKINSSITCKKQKMLKKDKEKIINTMINRLYRNKNNYDEEDNSLCNKYILREMKTSNYLKGYKKKI